MAWPPTTHQDVQDAVTTLQNTTVTKAQATVSGTTLMGLGDSITYNGGNDLVNNTATSGDRYYTDKSWHLHAHILGGGKFVHVGNAASGGYTIQQARDTWLSSVLAIKPTFCTVLLGQNNLGALSAADLSDLSGIYDSLTAVGITPVLCSVPATQTSTNLSRLNAWIGRQARTRGLPFADFYAATVDPTTGLYKAGYSSDGTHPLAAGAMPMGQALATALAPYLRPNAVDLAQSDGGWNGIVPGPIFTTDNGAAPPSPSTGWTPLTTYQVGDFSYTANPSGPGRIFNVSRRTGGVDNAIRAALGTPPVGNVLRVAARVTITVPAGGTASITVNDPSTFAVLSATFTQSITGTLTLERPVLNAGTHYVDVKAQGVDGVTVGLAQFTAVDLTALGSV